MADKRPMQKKNALGRGLGALLEDSPLKNKPQELLPSNPASGVFEIDLSQIQVNPYQPRMYFDKESLQELADSINIQGIIQPITVRRLSDG